MRRLRVAARLAFVGLLACCAIALAGSGRSVSWADHRKDVFVARCTAADAAKPSSTPTPTSTPVPSSVRFAVIGDFGSGSPDEAAVANLVQSWRPAFVVTVGDDRYNNPRGSNYDAVIGRFYCAYLKAAGSGPNCAGGAGATNRFFPATGNHDYSDGGGLAEYLRYFTLPGVGIATTGSSGSERYYDFVQGPVHFFVLDSMGALTSRADMEAQKRWLKAQLAASAAPWRLVILHHAPYSSGSHGSNASMQWPYAAWGADAVLAGHDHTYERLKIGDIPYFVNGVGGLSRYGFGKPVAGSVVRYNRDFGAMLVDANRSSITYRFITRAGGVIDTYTSDSNAASATQSPD